jgi:hypothetical protein
VPNMTVARLKIHVDERFAAVDERFEAIDARFDRLEKHLIEEHQTTRRHFDVVAERIEAKLMLFAEGYQANHDRLEDHERRIRSLETRS